MQRQKKKQVAKIPRWINWERSLIGEKINSQILQSQSLQETGLFAVLSGH